MGLRWSNCSWPLKVASFLALCVAYTTPEDFVQAQITPDSSLGAESSILSPNVTIEGLPAHRLDGGAIRGTSLFHSFQELNVGDGQRVFFSNPGGITNIFSRITGNNPSIILGTLGVNGAANLFLLNPNGIIFGPNATLDLSGSFLASSAQSIKFNNGIEFSTTNPSAPPLLTINVPLGLQYGLDPGQIIVQGQGNELTINQDTGEVLQVNLTGGLQVQPGQTLALAGGEVLLEGGSLRAESGRVEVWSLQEEGFLGLTPTNPGWELSHQGVENFQQIRLSQGAAIDTSGPGGGNIQIQGRRLALEDGSFILSLTQGEENGGTMSIKASDSITASGNAANGEPSLFLSETIGMGKAGDVEIITGKLILENGAQVSSGTFSQGSGGKIIVNASQLVEATGIAATENFASGLFSVARDNTGDGGSVEITTQRLVLRDGGQVSATTFSQGRGGNVLVNASESVAAMGIASIGASGLFAGSESSGEGGTLEINTGKLILRDGARISSDTFNQGNGGNVFINARESVQVIGIAENGNVPSTLAAQTIGTGNAGDIEIHTDKLILQDSGQVSTATFNQGNGGNLFINARESVQVIGIAQNSNVPSTLGAQTIGTGNAGDIEIHTDKLILQDSGQVSTATFNQGSGGNILVNARDSVQVIGIAQNSNVPSTVGAQTIGTGKAGDIEIHTDKLMLQDGGRVSAATLNQGNGGNILVNARESVTAIGFRSGLRAQTQGAGNGGTVTVNTDRFLASNGAQTVTVALANSRGQGGNINIHADEIQLTGTSDNGAPTILFATTSSVGKGGEIIIDTARLMIAAGAQLGAGTFSSGEGGNVFIQASDSVELFGTVTQLNNAPFFRDQSGQQFPSGVFTGSQGIGNAGKLEIKADRLTVGDGAHIAVSNQGGGDAGNLEVTTGKLLLDNRGVISGTTTSGQGGNLILQIDELLLLRRNSQISTTAGIDGAGGDGGNILIDSGFIVAIPDQNNDITANAFDGQGGEITINTRGIFSMEERLSTPANNTNDIDASSQFGLTGTVSINTPDLDPSRGLVELPDNFTDVSQQIVSSCNPGSSARRSSFTVTGRGGIARSPIEPFPGEVSTARWITLDTLNEPQGSHLINESFASSTPKIVEAQGWVMNPNGKISLVPVVPSVNSGGSVCWGQ